MVNEKAVKEGFAKVKEDMEGIKNELAFSLRRIAKIEEVLTKMSIMGVARAKKSSKKKL